MTIFEKKKKKKEREKKEKFLFTTTALHPRVTTGWCHTSDPQRQRRLCTRNSGPGACSAEIPTEWDVNLRGGDEIKAPRLCIGCVAQTLRVKLLPLLLLLHSQLLALVRC